MPFLRACLTLTGSLVTLALTVSYPGKARALDCSDAAVCQNAVFCTGFEETNPKANWDDADGNPNSQNLILQDPGPCQSSTNKVMKLIGHGSDMRKNFGTQSYDKLYFRWYIKYNAGYAFTCAGGGCHGPELAAGLPSGTDNHGDWLWDIGMFQSGYRPPLVTGNDLSDGNYMQPFYKANLDLIESSTASPHLYSYYHAMFMDGDGDCGGLPCFNVTGPSGSFQNAGVFGDIFPCTDPAYCEGNTNYAGHDLGISAMQTERWYCMEMMVDGGTPSSTLASAAGQVDFWIDGKEAGPFQKLWMRSDPAVKLRAIYLPNPYQGDILVDNVVVSTQRVGCLGAAPALPPASPTGLRVM